MKKKSGFKYFYGKDSEGREVVVAKLENCERDVIQSICKLTTRDTYPWSDGLTFGLEKKSLIIPDTFIGKATCSEKDEFNIAVGEQIARDRALQKYYRAKAHAISNWMEVAERKMSKMQQLEDYTYSKMFDYTRHNDLYGKDSF